MFNGLIHFLLIIHIIIIIFSNFLCNYLYELAGQFSRFYDACPVLKAAEPERTSRLALCELTGRALKQGLHVLGIETTDSM